MCADDKTAASPLADTRPGAGHASMSTYVRSEDLFRGAQEVVIRHKERKYRLRVTAQGKLILTA
jgi:hemin uptake protein HemP